MDVSGIAAVVTGGASGLGAATARALAGAGALVTIMDLAEEPAFVTEIGASFFQGDVTSVENMAAAVTEAGTAAPLRVAVACAGIGPAERTLNRQGEPADLDRFRRVIGVNLLGTFNLVAQAAAVMARTDPIEDAERGVIVNTASIAAFEGQIGQAAYAASKGGVVGLTLPVARDLSSMGIRCNTIAPGIIDTPLLGTVSEEVREALGASVPFPKRLGTREEYASLVLEIVRNSYLNGATIRLDGALRMAPK